MVHRSGRGVGVALALMVAAAILAAAPAPADDAAVAAREVARKWSDAVVTLKVVVKTRWVAEGRQEDESEGTGEVNATMIDPSGLVVCSLNQVDPSLRMEDAEEEEGFRMEAEVMSIHIIRPDGKELPAKVVLRDKELDLAFIRPTEPLPQPPVAVDLSASAQPEPLDQVVILGRMGQIGSRTPTVTLDRLSAIIEKPRKLYTVGLSAYYAGLGCPAFTLDGRVVGITFMRSAPRGADDGGRGGAMPVILPAAQIAEVAAQAPK